MKGEKDIEKSIAQPVPLHMRNASTKLMQELGHGKGYKYAHNSRHKITAMECLPENLTGRKYYLPTCTGKEQEFKKKKAEIEVLKSKI